MSITKHHESHCVGVLNNPPLFDRMVCFLSEMIVASSEYIDIRIYLGTISKTAIPTTSVEAA